MHHTSLEIIDPKKDMKNYFVLFFMLIILSFINYLLKMIKKNNNNYHLLINLVHTSVDWLLK